MKEMIAAGKVSTTSADCQINATVYLDEGTSIESSGDDVYYAIVKVKHDNYGSEVSAPLTFDDIKALGTSGKLLVPSMDGESTVELKDPVSLVYSKTKTFESVDAEGNTVYHVHAAIRYEW